MKDTFNSIAVVGSGNAGATLAAHLKLLGREVRLYDAFPAALKDIQDNDNTITLEGALDVQGEARIDIVTNDLAEAVTGAELIVCTTPAHVHHTVADNLAPLITADQVIVLNPGRTGGVLEVRKELSEHHAPDDVLVVETQTIAYACRKTGASVHVYGTKSRVLFSGLPAARIPEFTRRFQSLFPSFVPAPGGIWETSLNNIGMLFHPTPTLLNTGRMESGQPFDYYIDGFTPSIAHLVEQLDLERLQIAEAMHQHVPSVQEWLKTSYGAEGVDLYDALQHNNAYRGIKAPQLKDVNEKQKLRYVIEDVPTGLVPIAELGKKFNVATPAIDAMIHLAETLFERDFHTTGRTLEHLGIADMSREEIENLARPVPSPAEPKEA